MKNSWSAVRTTIAALPVKFVRYRMLGNDVTMSASSRCAASDWRTIWWRRLRAAVGAYDMNGLEPLLERRDHLHVLRLRGAAVGRLLDGCQHEGYWCDRHGLGRGRREF